MQRCVILGAGGHAAVLLDLITRSGCATIAGFLDADPKRWNTTMLGFPILGGDDVLSSLRNDGVTHFVVGVGGVGGSSDSRRLLFERGVSAGLRPLTIVHPSAIVAQSAELGEGAQLLPGCIVNVRTRVGVNAIVNSGSIVEHDCVIGAHAHIATGAVLAGGVHVGDGAHVGAAAVVRQGLTVGARAVVGAGAAVVKDVAPDTTVAGVPARELGRSPKTR